VGVFRSPFFDTTTNSAFVIDEINTMRLGNNYADFVDMEGNPHGSAHVSFGGFISSINTAARDPLFFLLHCNVDRLWSKWQWLNQRYDESIPTYPFLDSAGMPNATRVGHNWKDSMWPWNGIQTSPRPNSNPGGTFPTITSLSPGQSPIVGDMIDYQGILFAGNNLGFDYDDVPFEVNIIT
jgi:tyrosinase